MTSPVLHEWERLKDGLARRRVPGGWIYEIYWQGDLCPNSSRYTNGVNHVFVPDPEWNINEEP